MRNSPSTKRWRVAEGNIRAETLIQMELGVHPIVAKLLVTRGITSPEAAEAFLHPSLDSLSDPNLLPDAEVACERIKKALSGKEKIWIHGDYDGDGVTSAALWQRTLSSLKADVEVFVPHRHRDGYDMRSEFIQRAAQGSVGLIITTDCGIRRIHEVNEARERGIDVIVTDHHLPGQDGELPNAVAVVNPHREDSIYPYKNLAGVGVAFRLCDALVRHLGHNQESFQRHYLDLAAIGTLTDMMPLTEENRVIVYHGLKALQQTKKVGLQELMTVSGCRQRPVTSRDVGFELGPRLNAAGRVQDSRIALELLLSKDSEDAAKLARKLNGWNQERRDTQRQVEMEALAAIESQGMQNDYCIVAAQAGWHAGVVGLVAGRIVERYHRPCVLAAMDTETGQARASARSIMNFDIFEAISLCSSLLIEYGGHSHAAGLSMLTENLDDFRDQMNNIARQKLTEEDLVPILEIDAETELELICPQMLEQIESLAPFGQANPEPMFLSKHVRIREKKLIGTEKQHLKLLIDTPGLNGGVSDAIWWNQAHQGDELSSKTKIDICYQLQFNSFNSLKTIQFKIVDLHSSEN